MHAHTDTPTNPHTSGVCLFPWDISIPPNNLRVPAPVVLLSIVLVGFARWGFAANLQDACLSQVPASLVTAVHAQFPNFRLPLVTEPW